MCVQSFWNGVSGIDFCPSEIHNCFKRSQLELRKPQEQPQHLCPKPPRGAFCATVRAESESTDGSKERS
eukprot:4230467-Alexandrium_andersonii.AAC.1